MRLAHGLHLAYCTNIHRGETWDETFRALRDYTLAVRDRVGRGRPFAIGLRLGADAARELSSPEVMLGFRRWLDRENCYVFTINGFPYGRFHGVRVKEHVYAPDWATVERLEYTTQLFDILGELVPRGGEGSVSTVPCSYKEFINGDEQVEAMCANLDRCAEHIDRVSERTGVDLHLGLEPEPLCYLETTVETVKFFDRLREGVQNVSTVNRRIGVNYDACHLAVEYESAKEALGRLRSSGIRVSKLHLSSALKARPTAGVREALRSFVDPVYFHQVVERRDGCEGLRRIRDLDVALAEADGRPEAWGDEAARAKEWRIHFHVPLHCEPTEVWSTTSDHLQEVLDVLAGEPGMCRHLEMETYTWEVMPGAMKNRDVVTQLVGEYEWTLKELGRRGLGLV